MIVEQNRQALEILYIGSGWHASFLKCKLRGLTLETEQGFRKIADLMEALRFRKPGPHCFQASWCRDLHLEKIESLHILPYRYNSVTGRHDTNLPNS